MTMRSPVTLLLVLLLTPGSIPAAVTSFAHERGRLGDIHGSVILPDNGSPVGLRAVIRAGATPDSAPVAENGRFVLSVRKADCDSIDVHIETSPGSIQRYHAAHIRVGAPRDLIAGLDDDPNVSASIRVLLIPTTFTIDHGSYAGITVPIDLEHGVPGMTDRPTFWRVSRSDSGFGSPVAWPDGRLPIPVVFELPAGRIAAADSSAFWALARRLEHDVGRALFRPASPRDVAEAGRIVVRIDGAGRTPGITFTTWDSWGAVFHATVEVRNAALLRDSRVVTHELLHAIGAGHTSSRASIMGPPLPPRDRATAVDVAYLELLYRLRRIHVEERVSHGLLAAALSSRRAVSPPRVCRGDEPASFRAR